MTSVGENVSRVPEAQGREGRFKIEISEPQRPGPFHSIKLTSDGATRPYSPSAQRTPFAESVPVSAEPPTGFRLSIPPSPKRTQITFISNLSSKKIGKIEIYEFRSKTGYTCL